jgi:diguanylate cyclase (GGDEF)-like protein
MEIREFAFGISISLVLLYAMLALVLSRVRDEPAYRWLRTAGGLVAAGLCLNMLQGLAHPALSFVLGNALMVLGTVGFWQGCRLLVGKPPLRAAVWLLPAGMVVAGWAFGVAEDYLPGRVFSTSIALGIPVGGIAYALITGARHTNWPTLAKFLGMINLTLCLLFAARIVINVVFGIPRLSIIEPDPLNIVPYFAILLLYALFVMGLNVVVVTRLMNRLERLARHDALTGALNRLGLRDAIDSRTQRLPDAQCALMVMDLDSFKSINDAHGHEVGDRVLQRFADVVRQHASDTDLMARIGGEEFALLSSAAQPAAQAEAIRSGFAQAQPGLPACSVSIGLVECTAYTPEALREAFRLADEALYRAKSSGRNCVVTAPTEEDALRQGNPAEAEV